MSETTHETGSQTVESQIPSDEQNAAVTDAFEMFGISAFKSKENSAESESDSEKKTDKDDPAKDQSESEQQEKRIEKVKFNKQETEVDISTPEQLHDHLQRSLALDKERERRSDYEKALDRAAKLAGYENHEAYMKDLDQIEQQQAKQKEDEYAALRKELLEQADEAGLDPQKVEAWLDNHPLMQEAKKAKELAAEMSKQQETVKSQEEWSKQWNELYKAYPDLSDSSKTFDEGKEPEWFTDEMKAKIDKGYSPLDAYRLAHMDLLTSEVRKQERNEAIKQQMLNKRSQVETDSNGDLEPEVPEALTSAFSMFGLNPKNAKKYVKK